MPSKRPYAEEDEAEEETCRKLPRLVTSEYEHVSDKGMIDDTDGDLTVRCGPWVWQCHQDVLTSRCSFLKACCERGFAESTTREISLPEDEPRAIQAMLRYLYTLDVSQMFRSDEPLFSDVERDLDVFAIADKYGLDELREYMRSNLVLFYESDKRPSGDPKGWSAKNQEGFGRVLMKLADMEMDTKDIKKAVAQFIVRREQRVMKWSCVQKAIDDELWLRDEVALAAIAAKRQLQIQVDCLQREVEELQKEVVTLEDERDEAYGELENIQGLLDGAENAYYHWEYEWYSGGWDPGYDDRFCQRSTPEWFFDGYDEPDQDIQPLFVEDILSGVSFVLGEDGPEPLAADLADFEG